MSIRFWRRVRIIPGMRVNLSKSGASLSVGRRGAWITVGPRGRRATLGLPGTGLRWTEHYPTAAPRHASRRWALAIAAAVIALAALLFLLLGHFTP
jgi:Protein of unknown function (DUF4236)